MATHVISRRIQHIIQFIYNFKCPSKNQIIDFLREKDFNISSRTIERDFERIRTDYGLEIAYNKSNDGYFIDEEKSIKVNSFFKFLEIVTIADIFSNSLKNSKKILEYVSFDDSKSFKGIDNLKPILIAINERRLITFKHKNFVRKTITDYRITPLFLKEYENRWYVIGVPDDLGETRTFGIDRISNIKLELLSEIRKEDFDNELKVFENIVGLDHESNSKPYKVRLLINELQVNYLESLPLHHSQVIHSKNSKGQYYVDYFLFPNYEFKSHILKMGNDVVVLQPVELKKEIKMILETTLNKYD